MISVHEKYTVLLDQYDRLSLEHQKLKLVCENYKKALQKIADNSGHLSPCLTKDYNHCEAGCEFHAMAVKALTP